ncbi:protein-serine/threonine phosphatase [Ranunculus cassubicifolius]
MSNFQFSHLDSSTGRPRYKVNTLVLDSLQEGPNDDYCRIEDSQSVNVSANTLHSSLLSDEIKPATLKKLYQSKKLCTLLLLHDHQFGIRQVPQDFFQKLRFFKVLDLSRSDIIELPSSIGNLKELRYLNLSFTLITMLPESICTLLKLQTLKLKDCVELNDLPKDMRKLCHLRYLDLDVACLLATMPPGLGDLKELQRLSAFVVGKKNGYHITELKHLMNLRGTLRILRLESVSNSQEATEAEVYRKNNLDKLELQWTVSQDNLEVLEGLRPPPNLKELQIVGYGGAQFPQWVGDSSFSPNLVTLTLFNCGKCELLPPLGKLPFLKYIFISEMCSVKTIDNQFCGRDMVASSQYLKKLFPKKVSIESRDENKFNAFPKLENLKLSGMPNLEKWIGIEKGDFSFLLKLNISSFAKLTALPDISLFKSLQQLEITLCPCLRSVSNKRLPASLQSLLIIDCPLLKEHCCKKGRDWNKVAHIPNLWMDHQQVL